MSEFTVTVKHVPIQRNVGNQTNVWERGPVTSDVSAEQWGASSYRLDTTAQAFHFALAEIASHLAVKNPSGGVFVLSVDTADNDVS